MILDFNMNYVFKDMFATAWLGRRVKDKSCMPGHMICDIHESVACLPWQNKTNKKVILTFYLPLLLGTPLPSGPMGIFHPWHPIVTSLYACMFDTFSSFLIVFIVCAIFYNINLMTDIIHKDNELWTFDRRIKNINYVNS